MLTVLERGLSKTRNFGSWSSSDLGYLSSSRRARQLDILWDEHGVGCKTSLGFIRHSRPTEEYPIEMTLCRLSEFL